MIRAVTALALDEDRFGERGCVVEVTVEQVVEVAVHDASLLLADIRAILMFVGGESTQLARSCGVVDASNCRPVLANFPTTAS